jgi:hypothetical protein
MCQTRYARRINSAASDSKDRLVMILKQSSRHSMRLPLLVLLRTYDYTRLFVALSVIGLLVDWLIVTRLKLPVWVAVVLMLGLLFYPAIRKWHIDGQRWGRSIMILSILLVTQGLHTIEHVAQWMQYHLLHWPLKESIGLISPLNAEVVHFAWNWIVLLTVVYLLWAGHRNCWMWALLVWASAHTAEHTYMFINYLGQVERLTRLGLPGSAAQGLPGFLGKGGWLATHAGSSTPWSFICALAPVVKEAPRLDIHFWWNIGEIVLLVLAANLAVRQQLVSDDIPDTITQ